MLMLTSEVPASSGNFEDNVVFFIQENAQPNDVTPVYPPKRPAYVIEVNGGQIAQYGIKVNDKVELKIPNK